MAFLRRFLGLAALVGALSACAAPSAVLPSNTLPPVVADRSAEFHDTCSVIFREELGRAIDPRALEDCVVQATAGRTGDQIRQIVHDSDEAVAYRAHVARPSRAQVLAIKADFLSMRDSAGRIMLSWFYPSLDEATRADWRARWQAAGITHVVLCPVMQYPGYWAPGGDLRGQPDAYARANAELLDAGFVPINFLTSGDGGSADDIDRYWPALLTALQPHAPYIWVVPGFEVVGPGGGWTSAQLSKGLRALHTQIPAAALGVHLQPERATGASYPVEPDDPWQGDEAGFWKSHGGEFADALLYETPHGAKLLEGDGWEDRWVEILDRLGMATRGWRLVRLSFFETTGYDYYHGRATDADSHRLAQRAQRLAADRGVSITFGNGLP